MRRGDLIRIHPDLRERASSCWRDNNDIGIVVRLVDHAEMGVNRDAGVWWWILWNNGDLVVELRRELEVINAAG